MLRSTFRLSGLLGAGLVAALASACRTETQPTTVVIPPAPSSSAGPPTPVHMPPPAAATGGDDTCRSDADCDWGEIDHDIHAAAECMCLLGCPHIIQNKATAGRREAQYRRFCHAGVDGEGNGCPIDDCAPPPPLRCASGTCRPMARD